MGPRSIYAILALGIVAVVSMGLMTKYLFDSNPGLRKATRFKAEVLEKFGERGVHEVSYRKTREPRGVELRLVVEPETLRTDDSLDLDIARLYLATYPMAHAHLKLRYSIPSRWGCRSSSERVERLLDIVEVRRKLRERDQKLALQRAAAELGGVEVRDVTRSGSEIVVTASMAEPETEGAEEMPAKLARLVVKTYRPPRTTRIRVRLLSTESPPDEAGDREAEEASPPDAPPAMAEEVFDFRGRKLPADR